MKKPAWACCVLLLLSFQVQAQDFDAPAEGPGRNLIHLDGALLLTNVGMGNGAILNFGYELFFIDILSVEASLNLWLMIDTYVGGKLGLLLHPWPGAGVDPFIGVGLAYGLWINSRMRTFDIPLLFGLNLMFTDFMGIRFGGQLYLLSLQYLITEIGAGLVFRF